MAEENKSDSNILAAVSYLWVVSVIMYIIKKDDEFVQFHAKQGIVLFVASLFGIIPVFGWILSVVAFVFAVIGAAKAYTGEKYRLPVVANLAEKINF